MYKFYIFFLAFVLILFLGSCTSNIANGLKSKELVKVESIPSGVTVFIQGELVGVTPLSLNLDTSIVHELLFKKKGFSSTRGYFEPVQKNSERKIIQFGVAMDLGFYYELSPKKLSVELMWNELPDTKGIMPFENMGKLISRAGEFKSNGSLTEEEHEIVTNQIIGLFYE